MNKKKNICGLYIRRLRREKGLTQQQLAALLGKHGWPVTRHVISNIECGRRCVWAEELAVLSKCLQTPVARFLGWIENQN